VNRFKEARSLYLQAGEGCPQSVEIFFRLGFVEDKLGDKTACARVMRRAIELDPDHAEALNYLAYAWAERDENLPEALTMALKAGSLRPDNGYIVDTVAWIYFVMGDVKKALPLLERAAQLSDEDPVVMEHLGDAFRRLGRRDEARRAYVRSVEKGHESPESVNEKLEEIGARP
jgi:Flp pilus assembly protein TadD